MQMKFGLLMLAWLATQSPVVLAQASPGADHGGDNTRAFELDDSPEDILNALMSQGRELPDAAALAVQDAQGVEQRRALVDAALCMAQTEAELDAVSETLLGSIDTSGEGAGLAEAIRSFGFGSCDGQEPENVVKPPQSLTDQGSGPGTNVISPSS